MKTSGLNSIANFGQALVLAGLVLAAGCGTTQAPQTSKSSPAAAHPSLLLVTLDTTRADAMGPDAVGVQTPAFNALAARGRRFAQAYATAPETLPSHASLMTGLYPAGHGVHENARYVSAKSPVLAERLQQAGYRTVAAVSAFTLARRFGLARGFDVYDDELPANQAERPSRDTTDGVIGHLSRESRGPLLLWVHYYDPHAPYAPPEPYRRQYASRPYLGEIAAMDEQLGRLVDAFEQHVKRLGGTSAIIVVADHGEGLGEHGELQHGNLLYQSTMHVPLLLIGPGVTSGVSETPVSTRRVFQTLLDWAGVETADSLRGSEAGVVLGEAMKPFLEFGWQPQVMTVQGRNKFIRAGGVETYDVIADPMETQNLAAGAAPPADVVAVLRDYPTPSGASVRPPDSLGDDARRKLATLGYVSSGAAPVVRKDAPRPADMVHLLDTLDRSSSLFVSGQYAKAIPLLERIVAADPHNLDAVLRLATSQSMLGHDAEALRWFSKASEIAPQSQDVRTYLALHYARGQDWQRATPLLEGVIAESPDRLPALEALAVIREREGRVVEAIAVRQKIYAMRNATPPELLQLGRLAMQADQPAVAVEAFEKARTVQGAVFGQNLELGVSYFAARRFPEAGATLDRVPPSDRGYPMALFKRAQVSVLLNEPDRAARIDLARRHADATTRPLIARERLFQGVR